MRWNLFQRGVGKKIFKNTPAKPATQVQNPELAIVIQSWNGGIHGVILEGQAEQCCILSEQNYYSSQYIAKSVYSYSRRQALTRNLTVCPASPG